MRMVEDMGTRGQHPIESYGKDGGNGIAAIILFVVSCLRVSFFSYGLFGQGCAGWGAGEDDQGEFG